MKKRDSERVPVFLEFNCFDIEGFGVITNISETGMFLKSHNITFPLDSEFEISICIDGEMLTVPVRVSRMTKSSGYYDGIGVELLERPQAYSLLVDNLRSVDEEEYSTQKPAFCIS